MIVKILDVFEQMYVKHTHTNTTTILKESQFY